MAKPLTCLLKKEAVWNWTPTEQTAWEKLKEAISSEPVVRLPRREGRYRVYTDWSADYMSAILHQLHDGVEHPIYFASRACKGAEARLGSAEGELLAVVFGLQKFK